MQQKEGNILSFPCSCIGTASLCKNRTGVLVFILPHHRVSRRCFPSKINMSADCVTLFLRLFVNQHRQLLPSAHFHLRFSSQIKRTKPVNSRSANVVTVHLSFRNNTLPMTSTWIFLILLSTYLLFLSFNVYFLMRA